MSRLPRRISSTRWNLLLSLPDFAQTELSSVRGVQLYQDAPCRHYKRKTAVLSCARLTINVADPPSRCADGRAGTFPHGTMYGRQLHERIRNRHSHPRLASASFRYFRSDDRLRRTLVMDDTSRKSR